MEGVCRSRVFRVFESGPWTSLEMAVAVEMTPLPYRKIAVLVMVFLGDSLCMSVVLPFVPFMVKTYLELPAG